MSQKQINKLMQDVIDNVNYMDEKTKLLACRDLIGASVAFAMDLSVEHDIFDKWQWALEDVMKEMKSQAEEMY
jgi:hypothetical protein